MFDLWLIVIRETVWKVVKARIEWCEWQIHSAGGFTIVPTDPVPVTSIVSFVQEVLLLSLRLSVTGDAIDRYEQCRRLWLCQRTVWSVTDRARGRVTSLPWSPARAAGSKVFPNLQTILFSTNKPKISTSFKVSSFPFYVWRWESCLQAWTENIFHLVQNSPTFSSASSPMRGRRLSKGSGGNRWEVGNLG